MANPRLGGVAADMSVGLLTTRWAGDEGGVEGTTQQQQYPFVWLRDNCQCPSCFHPVSKARLLLMRHLDPQVSPKSVQIERESDEVVITWPDDHVSRYPVTWLWERRFADDGQEKRVKFGEQPIKLWGSELEKDIPTDTFSNILNGDSALYEWIRTMEEIGIFVIKGVPCAEGQLAKLAARVAFLRATCYGQTFQVKAKPSPSNVAYTSATLGLHTDLPQYFYVPGVQMLHCISQTTSEGGTNEFADGFLVAEKLKAKDPEAFRILTTVPVDFYDVGDDYFKFCKLQRKPTISLRMDGEIEQINYNNQIRDTHLSVPLDQVQPLYAALRKFDDLLYHEENLIHIKLNAGEIVCFHNYRTLHGRLGFSVAQGGQRHLEGGYLDWDELSSRRRVLQEHV